MVGEWAEREAECMSRPLGDQREITEADLWARTARNMAAKPYKSPGIDLADKLRAEVDAVHNRFIRSDLRIQRQQAEGRDHGAEFATWQQNRAIRRNGEAIEGFRAAVAGTLRELGRRMEQVLHVLEQQVRRARQARPAPQPAAAQVATPDQPRLDAPALAVPAAQPSGGFRM